MHPTIQATQPLSGSILAATQWASWARSAIAGRTSRLAWRARSGRWRTTMFRASTRPGRVFLCPQRALALADLP